MLQGSVSDSTGLSLETSVRNLMEARFRSDFEQVRIHTGPTAVALSRLCSARACTSGEQIFFDSGQYAPDTASGRWLLAHELAHVVQQRTAHSILWSQGSLGDVFEQEADDAASMVSQGCRASVRRWNSVPHLQCDDHLKLSFPPLRSPLSMRRRSPAPDASNLVLPRLTLTPPTFRMPRRGPPSLFLPSQLTLRLPPIIGAAPLTRFTVPTRGTTGFSFSELEPILQRRSNLSFVSTGAPSLHLDPLLFEVLRNPAMLRPDPPRPPLFPMRGVTTADFGADVAFGDNLSFELWVAMVLQADLYQLRGHGLGLDLFHQPTGQLTFGLPLSHGGTAYVGTNISATLLNFHIFRDHGAKELFEIGLGQTGLTFQNDILFRNRPTYSLQEAAVVEGHITDKFSLILTAGFNLSIDQHGLDTHPSPFINLGLVFHAPAIDGKGAGAK